MTELQNLSAAHLRGAVTASSTWCEIYRVFRVCGGTPMRIGFAIALLFVCQVRGMAQQPSGNGGSSYFVQGEVAGVREGDPALWRPGAVFAVGRSLTPRTTIRAEVAGAVLRDHEFFDRDPNRPSRQLRSLTARRTISYDVLLGFRRIVRQSHGLTPLIGFGYATWLYRDRIFDAASGVEQGNTLTLHDIFPVVTMGLEGDFSLARHLSVVGHAAVRFGSPGRRNGDSGRLGVGVRWRR